MRELTADLEAAIRNSWSRDTSNEPALWTPDNPAFGQCAVTACVLQDYIKGDLLATRARVANGDTTSHYFNIVDLATIDLTREQFPDGTQFDNPKSVPLRGGTMREFCLSFPDTEQRYKLLSEAVSINLQTA